MRAILRGRSLLAGDSPLPSPPVSHFVGVAEHRHAELRCDATVDADETIEGIKDPLAVRDMILAQRGALALTKSSISLLTKCSWKMPISR